MASSNYLPSKTKVLTSTTPVSPSQAHDAQIPLQSFNLPTFPPEALTAGLGTLILTDIKLDEYTDLLTQPFSIPELPGSINSLTLEQFALGYPPSFPHYFGKRLSNLKTLTIYAQLLAGTTPASREDAVNSIGLRSRKLHLLDFFGPQASS